MLYLLVEATAGQDRRYRVGVTNGRRHACLEAPISIPIYIRMTPSGNGRDDL